MAQEALAQPRRTAATTPVAAPRAGLRRSARLGRRVGILRRRRRRCALGRVRDHCGARHRALGTLMRHDLLGTPALAIAPRAMCMGKASAPAALVALSRPTQRLAPGPIGALRPAIPLAAITAAAHQHPHAAAGTGKYPGIALRHLALLRSTHRRLALEASASPPPRHGRIPIPGVILRTHSQRPTHEWGAAASPLMQIDSAAAPASRPSHGSTPSAAMSDSRAPQSRITPGRNPTSCWPSCIAGSSLGPPSRDRQGRGDGSISHLAYPPKRPVAIALRTHTTCGGGSTQ